MLAWADRDALRQTLATGEAWYWSRSRGKLWHKGSTSGHVQLVRTAFIDCDGDAVLLMVDQTGAACHTGEWSCFHRPLDGAAQAHLEQQMSASTAGPKAGPEPEPAPQAIEPHSVLAELASLVTERARSGGPQSYVRSLTDHPDPLRPLQKVGEEAVEFALAAAQCRLASPVDEGANARAKATAEAADLVFHLLVALRSCGIELDQLWLELQSRRRPSGRETS
jgi:phosphoribosyl-ATP pyrophosphohydrolase/phosphoribosyl-AMP cyclohydrolase